MTNRASLVFPALLMIAALAACDDKKTAPTTSTTVTPAASTSAAASATPTALKEGDAAPDVEMTLQDGKKLKLSSLKGQLVAVYFYPKDMTSGCTMEAENFRDRWDDLKKAGIAVIGVSTQDAASHKQFIEKEKLPFDLAIDTDQSLAKAFGVPVSASGYHARQTFLIGKDGMIKKIWRDVTPKDHANEVLAAAGKA